MKGRERNYPANTERWAPTHSHRTPKLSWAAGFYRTHPYAEVVFFPGGTVEIRERGRTLATASVARAAHHTGSQAG
jgi:hypothetical protein